MKKHRKNIARPGKNRSKSYVRTGALSKTVLQETTQSYAITSRLRSIGNSKGVILPNRVIVESGISPDADLIIQVSDGVIQITEARQTGRVNTDLSTWEEQFKKTIKMGNKPDPDIWEDLHNRFDEEEWT